MAIRVWRGLPWPGARKDVESSQTPRAWQGLEVSLQTSEHRPSYRGTLATASSRTPGSCGGEGGGEDDEEVEIEEKEEED